MKGKEEMKQASTWFALITLFLLVASVATNLWMYDDARLDLFLAYFSIFTFAMSYRLLLEEIKRKKEKLA